MGLFKRTKRVDLGKYEAPPFSPPAPVERVTEEGVLIAASAVRMAVKNQLIVAALRDHLDYDPDRLAEFARLEFLAIADQSDASGDRAQQKRDTADPWKAAASLGGQLVEEIDEHERRAILHHALGAMLREVAEDPARVAAVVEEARAVAWEEIGAVIESTIGAARDNPALDDDYEASRAARVRAMLEIDLVALLRQPRL